MRDRDLPPRPPLAISDTCSDCQLQTGSNDEAEQERVLLPNHVLVKPALTKVGGRMRAVWQEDLGNEENHGSCANDTAVKRRPRSLGRRSLGSASSHSVALLSEVADQALARTSHSSETLSCSSGRSEQWEGGGCSSRSLSHCPLREINVQARFDALHKDGEYRRIRREQAAEKKRLQQAEREERPPSARRSWDHKWAEEQIENHLEKQRTLEAQRARKANWAECREACECSFTPRLVSQSAGQRRLLKAQQLLKKVAGRQQACLQRLREIKDNRNKLEVSVEAKRRSREEEARQAHWSSVEEFLASVPGWRMLAAQAQAYKEANPGIPNERAVQEAARDIVHANEASAIAAAVSSLEEERAVEHRRLLIGCLQIVHELVSLDDEASKIAADVGGASRLGRTDPSSLCSDFKSDLIAQLKTEDWYVEAMRSDMALS